MGFLESINGILWGTPLLFLLLFTAAAVLAGSRFAPVRGLFLWHRDPGDAPPCGKLTLLQSSTASLAAAMGTGNLIGVAAALRMGGAGAVFWMWIAALLGMVLLYGENALGCKFRRRLPDGTLVTGAMAYIRFGLKKPWLSWSFAFFCTVSAFGMGNTVQSNALAQTLRTAWNVPSLCSGLAAALLTGWVILGGSKRVGAFTRGAVPLLSAVYLLAAGAVVWKFRENLPAVMETIFREAGGFSAIGGGFCGAALSRAVSVGLRRGIFSTEAGLGSSSILHGEADTGSGDVLGKTAMLEAFVDTFLCCTPTALAILCSGAVGADDSALLLSAFEMGLGSCARWLLPVILGMLALCTLIGWSYCGEAAFSYLTKGKFRNVYRLGFCIAAVLGSVMQLSALWTLADIANAAMAYCSLPAILCLAPCIAPSATAHTAREGMHRCAESDGKGGKIYPN